MERSWFPIAWLIRLIKETVTKRLRRLKFSWKGLAHRRPRFFSVLTFSIGSACFVFLFTFVFLNFVSWETSSKSLLTLMGPQIFPFLLLSALAGVAAALCGIFLWGLSILFLWPWLQSRSWHVTAIVGGLVGLLEMLCTSCLMWVVGLLLLLLLGVSLRLVGVHLLVINDLPRLLLGVFLMEMNTVILVGTLSKGVVFLGGIALGMFFALFTRRILARATHLDTARDAVTQANRYQAQGKYEEAEALYKRGLAINEQELGEKHSSTAASLNNLALLYKRQGKYSEAEVLYRRALAICEQELGEKHPSTATSLNNLALLYKTQGESGEAEVLYKRALAIWKQQLGEKHPSTAQGFHHLATLYEGQGKYMEAEPLFKCALAIREQALGSEHPLTQNTRGWYVLLLRKLGRDEEASMLESGGQLPG